MRLPTPSGTRSGATRDPVSRFTGRRPMANRHRRSFSLARHLSPEMVSEDDAAGGVMGWRSIDGRPAAEPRISAAPAG